MKKNISFILIVMLLLSSLGITTFSANPTVECKQTVNSTDLGSATEVISKEEKILCDATLEDDFEEDCIIVVVKRNDNKSYNVQDFPELILESVELLSDVPETNSQLYSLYLQNKGKDNVINAIKNLDYRANLDMKLAMPNYIYIVEY